MYFYINLKLNFRACLTFSKSLRRSFRERSSGIGESVFVCGGRETCSPPERTGNGIELDRILPGVGSMLPASLGWGDWGLAAMGGRWVFFLGVSDWSSYPGYSLGSSSVCSSTVGWGVGVCSSGIYGVSDTGTENGIFEDNAGDDSRTGSGVGTGDTLGDGTDDARAGTIVSWLW